MNSVQKGYTHIDVAMAQAAKGEHSVCGDLAVTERTPEATTVLLCDGLGSGIKAHVAATLCASRMMELMRRGVSLMKTCESLMQTMHQARTEDIPFSAFCLVRVLNDGSASVLTYEMPAPVAIQDSRACILPQHFFTLGGEVLGQAHLTLHHQQHLLLFSDGISQAGMGQTLRLGWTSEGVRDFVNKCIAESRAMRDVPEYVLAQAGEYSQGVFHDDATACLITSRPGKPLTILSGPPLSPHHDRAVVQEFMDLEGPKIICGSTTAEIVSRSLGISMQVQEELGNYFEPPRYYINGVDLVTEGAFTLNRVCNIFDEDPRNYQPDSGVSRFCEMIREADHIVFWVGRAPNPANESILFKELGILPRLDVVPLLAEKIRKCGKLVVVNYL